MNFLSESVRDNKPTCHVSLQANAKCAPAIHIYKETAVMASDQVNIVHNLEGFAHTCSNFHSNLLRHKTIKIFISSLVTRASVGKPES